MEFALVSILFFFLVFGMVDVGRAVWNYNTLAQATREGTRYAIVHSGNSSDPSGPGSAYYTSPNTDTMVTSQYEYEPIFSFQGLISFTMTSSSTMEITN